MAFTSSGSLLTQVNEGVNTIGEIPPLDIETPLKQCGIYVKT